MYEKCICIMFGTTYSILSFIRLALDVYICKLSMYVILCYVGCGQGGEYREQPSRSTKRQEG